MYLNPTAHKLEKVRSEPYQGKQSQLSQKSLEWHPLRIHHRANYAARHTNSILNAEPVSPDTKTKATNNKLPQTDIDSTLVKKHSNESDSDAYNVKPQAEAN